MKVIVDKLQAPPPHALTVAEVKALIGLIPAEWSVRVSVVHLKATLPEHSRFVRPVIDDLGRELRVCSRGLTPQHARKEILRELAVQGLRKSLRRVHRLSAAETEEIDRIIAPLLAQAETGVTAPGEQPDSLDDHRAFQALEAAGYSWGERYQIIRSIKEERRHPTSRRKANRINRAEQALREAGIDPLTLLSLEDAAP